LGDNQESLKNQVWERYITTCFNVKNKFTKEEFEEYARNCDRVYSKLLPQNKEANILDVGCGAGHFLYYLEQKGYTNYYGIDISPEQMEFVKNNITERVEVADVFDFLKMKSNQFDAIIANDIIEHIPRDQTLHFLNLVYSSLKLKGRCMLKTVNMNAPFPAELRYIDFTHETGFTEISLAQILKIANFVDVRAFPWPLKRISRFRWSLRQFFVYKLLLGVSINSPSLLLIGTGIRDNS
jgi:cyclopropane fatty-acyl-phospholipid synthase-like methyltransferase